MEVSLNKERIKILQKVLKENHKEFNMEYWSISPGTEQWKKHLMEYGMTEDENCGTVMCIAGWASHLFDSKYHDTLKRASFALGMPYNLGDFVFYEDDWPIQLGLAYIEKSTTKQKVDLVCEFLDRLMECDFSETDDYESEYRNSFTEQHSEWLESLSLTQKQ